MLLSVTAGEDYGLGGFQEPLADVIIQNYETERNWKAEKKMSELNLYSSDDIIKENEVVREYNAH